MSKVKTKRVLLCILAIVIALVWVFPIVYMVISSFKVEAYVSIPGIHHLTLQNYKDVLTSTFFHYLRNSILITLVTVAFTILLGVPASYGIVYTPLKFVKKVPIFKTRDGLHFWFISTTFLPAIAVIIPVYLMFQKLGLIDNPLALILLYTGTGIPMMIWLTTNFFKEIPSELIEAAQLDGCNRKKIFFRIMIPLVMNGVISAALLVFIITWNEFFFAITLTGVDSPTLPVYMSKYMVQQGYYWGKMSATGTLLSIIPIFLGFFAQKALVKGLTSGSVKG